MARRADMGEAHYMAFRRSALDGLQKRLETLSPAQVLSRGYAVVRRRQDGVVVSKVKQARGGIVIHVSDGEFDAEVKENSDK